MYYPGEMKARVSLVQWSKPYTILAPTQDSNPGGRIQNDERWPLHYHCTQLQPIKIVIIIIYFLKRPFLPRSARVRRFSPIWGSPHILEHCPFRVQTKINHIIFYTFSPSLPVPTHTSHPRQHHISTGQHPIISILTSSRKTFGAIHILRKQNTPDFDPPPCCTPYIFIPPSPIRTYAWVSPQLFIS